MYVIWGAVSAWRARLTVGLAVEELWIPVTGMVTEVVPWVMTLVSVEVGPPGKARLEARRVRSPVTRLTVMSLDGAVDEVIVNVAISPSSLAEALSTVSVRMGYGLTLTVTCTATLGSMFGPTATAWMSRDWGVVVRETVKVPLEALNFWALRRLVSVVRPWCRR